MRVAQSVKFAKKANDLGSYWTSTAAPKAVLAFARDQASTLHKEASVGGEQEQGFEQAFSSLAYAYLKDKSPRLLDYVVGFQLIDRNEDNTKAVGIFGFKVGDYWLYAPVFFLNGDLKGHELLYIKNQDTFVPMKENWVNYMISRRPHVLGEGSDQNTHQLGGMMPNLSRMSRPPGNSKYGSDAGAAPQVDAWAVPALPLMFALMTKRAAVLYEKRAGDLAFGAVVERPFAAALAPVAAKFDMRNFLSEFPLLKAAYDRCYSAYPLLKVGFDRFYGTAFFADMARGMKQAADSLIKTAAPKRPAPPPPAGRYLIPEAKAVEKNAGLYVYAVDEEAPGGIDKDKPELTEEEREKLLADTVLIKDERPDERTSKAYNTQTKLELINPHETGLYEVLEKPGSFDQMVVIQSPQSGRGREPFSLVLRKSAPKNWKNTHSTNLWAKSCDCPVPADWRAYVDGLSGLDTLEKGGSYVAVHANGSGTCVFRVMEKYDDGGYSVDWQDHCGYGDRPAALPKVDRPQDWEVGYSPWRAKVHINKKTGTGLRSVNGELSIPESYKVIKVSDPPKPKKDDDSLMGMCCSPAYAGEQSEDEPIAPGNLVDVQLLIHNTKVASALDLHAVGTKVVVRSGGRRSELTKTAALVHLVRDHGLREAQAREMLKLAADKRTLNLPVKFRVKYAQGYSLQGGPGAPEFPEPQMGSEQIGNGSVSSIYPQEEFLPVDEMSAQQTDPSIYDPFYEPDQQAMQTAQQASQSGQKEVFDTAMIGGMLKSVRQDSLVDRYLGDLMKAVDKLGRILFMFYWHQEEFEDRYGRQDLPELEDSLRNAFEVLGDVVLFLTEKTVQGGAGLMQSSGVGATDDGEPSIQEAARN